MQPTIFRAKTIVTMTADAPPAFAALGEWIVAMGTVADLRGRFPAADVVDFGDAAIAAHDMLHLDFSAQAVGSLAEIIEKLRAQCRITPPGEWIRGSRYDDAKMSEGRVLNRWDLDEVSREHPLMIVQIAGHWGVVNAKALELGGIDETSQPPEGGKFGRDASGRLNGILFEQAIFDYAYPQAARRSPTVAPASTRAERRHGLRLAMAAFHAAGITSPTP